MIIASLGISAHTLSGAMELFVSELRVQARVHKEGVEIAWTTRPGASYLVMYSNDISNESWAPINPWIQATNGLAGFLHKTSNSSGFYRVIFDSIFPGPDLQITNNLSFDAGDFYRVLERDAAGNLVSGERRLRRALGLLSVRLNESSAALTNLRTRSNLRLKLSSALGLNLNVWEIENEQPDRKLTLTQALADLIADDRVDYAWPVFYAPGGGMVIVKNELLVSTKSAGSARVQDLLSHYGLGLFGLVSGHTNVFSAYALRPKGLDLLALSRTVMDDPDIHYAEPNFICDWSTGMFRSSELPPAQLERLEPAEEPFRDP